MDFLRSPFTPGVVWGRHEKLIFGLLLGLGLLVRIPFISSGISDFPQDRNSTTYNQMLFLERVSRWVDPGPMARHFTMSIPWQPEMQFVAIAGFVLSELGVPLVIGGRLFNVALNLFGAAGIYLLARGLWGRRAGAWSMAAYLFLPMSVLMGRSLLPDNIAATLIIWGMVLAADTVGLRRPWRVGLLLVVMILTALAKLPFTLFLPLIALFFILNEAPERRRIAILIAIAGLALAYIATCLQYRLNVFNPFPGLQGLTLQFRNVSATWAERLGDRMPYVLLGRSVLMLTLPGVLLAIVGSVLLWGHRWAGPVLVWLGVALLFGIYYIKANTYWLFPLVAPGSLLIGFVLARPLLVRRGPALLMGLMLLVAFNYCPGTEQVRIYLSGQTLYEPLRELRGLISKPLLYRMHPEGPHPEGYTGVDGYMDYQTGQEKIEEQLAGGQLNWFINGISTLDQVDRRFFFHYPIERHRLMTYSAYHTAPGAAIERPPVEVPGAIALDAAQPIAPGLAIEALATSPSTVRRGGSFELVVNYRQLEETTRPLIGAEFTHVATSQTIPLHPVKRAVNMGAWPAFLQVPTFREGTHAQVAHRFEVPAQVPVGEYRLTLRAYTPRIPAVEELGEIALVESVLTVEGEPSRPTWEADAHQLYYFGQLTHGRMMLFGRLRNLPALTSGTLCLAVPNLNPGRYVMSISASANPAGFAEAERWPVLAVYSAQSSGEMRFDASGLKTHRLEINWSGNGDMLRFELDNPGNFNSRKPNPLYLEDVSYGERTIIIWSVSLRPVRE